jgi:methylated-DNA-[protein]-cysteine S-methyltransferase
MTALRSSVSAHLDIPSPLGPLAAAARDGRLVALRFGARSEGTGETTPELEAAAEQLGEYFAGRRRSFDLPLALPENPFRRHVLEALQEIPFGESTTYGRLTTRLGLPSSHVRKVGGAIARNPLAIVVPCHRVLGADGSLTGYAGGLERKAGLLALEAPQLQLG